MDDLKIIKKKYGEKMEHLCRELFPSILEKPGLLSSLILEHFVPSNFLYDDLVENKAIEEFKNYIYSLIKKEVKEEIDTGKNPYELLKEKGYILYECKTEQEIQQFKKYYALGEELCTFKGDRLNKCHVFFAVKENVDEIKREEFPSREDEYGVSVISIQFSKGKVNTLSIKNRYNHTVKNPDNTFKNNLENIIPGLSRSFKQYYGYNFDVTDNDLEIPGYANIGGKYYKYNYEIDDIYYCSNNIIIDNGTIIDKCVKESERYIVMDWFIIDLKEKIIYTHDYEDYFGYEFRKDNGESNIDKIYVFKDKTTGERFIKIVYDNKNKEAIIKIDKYNRMIEYHNEYLTKIPSYYMAHSNYLRRIEVPNLENIGSASLLSPLELTEFTANKLVTMRENCFYNAPKLIKFEANKLRIMGNNCLHSAECLESFSASNLEKMFAGCFTDVPSLTKFRTNKLRRVGLHCFSNSQVKKVINEDGTIGFILPEHDFSKSNELNLGATTNIEQSIHYLYGGYEQIMDEISANDNLQEETEIVKRRR